MTRAWSRWPRVATTKRSTCCGPRSTATPPSAARPRGWAPPRRWRAREGAAEALAGAGAADGAAAEVGRAARDPVGPADQPWALVPRMARVQGLVARAR